MMIPLWNTWYFFALYANAAAAGTRRAGPRTRPTCWTATCSRSAASSSPRRRPLDVRHRRCLRLVRGVRRRADELVHPPVARPLLGRRTVTSTEAFDTLYTVLETVCRVDRAAAAAGHRGDLARPHRRPLGPPGRLADRDELPVDDELVAAMDAVRDVCSAGSALRKAEGLRDRLPLASLTVVVADAAALAGSSVIADELNVKPSACSPRDAPSPRRTASAAAHGQRPRRRAAPGQAGAAGHQGSKSGDWSVRRGRHRHAGGLALSRGSTPSRPWPAPRRRYGRPGCCRGGGFVVLDTASTPELEAEGLARDVVRAVQQARRDAGLDVCDRIALGVSGSRSRAGRGPHPRGAARRRDARPPPWFFGSEAARSTVQVSVAGGLSGGDPRDPGFAGWMRGMLTLSTSPPTPSR